MKDNKDKAEKTFLEKKLEELEKKSSEANGSVGIVSSNVQKEDDEKLKLTQEKLEIFRQDYETKKNEAATKAKNLLREVSKIYLTEKMIEDNEYVQFKIDIDEMSLSNLIFQIDVSNRVIFKLSEQIYMGSTNTRVAEVLGGLQRVALEISKFQCEFVKSVEDGLRKLKSDLEIREIELNTSGTGTGGDDKKEISSNIIRDRKELVDQMQGLLKEARETMVATPSANKKLNKEVIEIEEIKDPEENTSLENDETLESY